MGHSLIVLNFILERPKKIETNLKTGQYWHVLSQIREQMSGPDLHVFTLKFHSNFSPKKPVFFTFSDSKKKNSKKIL